MEKRYLTVSAINRYLKAKFEQDKYLRSIDIKGEISNLKKHYSGHYYFTLKDEHSKISAIMFSTYVKGLQFELEEGMQVLIHGSITVYENGGNYSLQVYSIEMDGIGNLYLMIEKTKKKLAAEGLFDSRYKKSIPLYPSHIGVIAAKDSAALKDIINTINRRYPIATLHIYHAPVQGKDAYKEIITQLQRADDNDLLDVIILARGGGSLEDLMNFNEEALVRCIFNCNTPIITGVGHEIDYTLVDFVADLRAPTPTGAAMMASIDLKDLSMSLDEKQSWMIDLIKQRIDLYETKLKRYDSMPVLLEKRVSNERMRYNLTVSKIKHLSHVLILNRQNQIKIKMDSIQHMVEEELKYKQIRFSHSIDNLTILSPLNTLKRGYSIVSTNHIVSSIHDVSKNETINIQMSDGKLQASIIEIQEKLISGE